MHYETEGMARIRKLLNEDGVTDEQVDTFKDVLIRLERKGFRLEYSPKIRL